MHIYSMFYERIYIRIEWDPLFLLLVAAFTLTLPFSKLMHSIRYIIYYYYYITMYTYAYLHITTANKLVFGSTRRVTWSFDWLGYHGLRNDNILYYYYFNIPDTTCNNTSRTVWPRNTVHVKSAKKLNIVRILWVPIYPRLQIANKLLYLISWHSVPIAVFVSHSVTI